MKQHTNLVAARVREITALASKTFVAPAQRGTDGKLPIAPYVVIYPAEGTDTASRLTGPVLSLHPRFTLHIVGSSYDNAATVAALVKAKFVVNGVGVQAVITGENPSGMAYESPQPIQVDYDVTPALVYAVAEIFWNTDLLA